MSASEIAAILARSAEDFLQERIAAGIAEDQAREEIRQSHARLLPAGSETAGHHFCWIVGDGTRAGQIWFGPLPGQPQDYYLFDIIVDPDRRGEGIATAAIERMLSQTMVEGAARVGLTVFDNNAAAIHVYEKFGFVTSRAGDGRREMWYVRAGADADPV